MSIGFSRLQMERVDIRHSPSSFHNHFGKVHHQTHCLQVISGNSVRLERNLIGVFQKIISAETEKTDTAGAWLIVSPIKFKI